MKIRKGWYVVWPDGTRWFGNCKVWARQPLMAGARLVTVKIVGAGCAECAAGKH